MKTLCRKSAGAQRRSDAPMPAPFMLVGCVILLVLYLVPDLRADTVVLREGQTITGQILLEKENQLYVDIGITVLAIPKEKILQYEYT